MVQLKTILNCLDNSGAALVECANVIKKKSDATIGDRIVVVVKRTRSLGAEGASSSAIANRVKKGDIRQGVVVRTRQNIQRPDGSVIKFGDNACVLVNKSGDPIGTRVTGLVGQELRKRNWSKILSLASMHL